MHKNIYIYITQLMNHSYLDTGVAKQYVVRISLIDFYTMYCTVFDMLKLVVQRITKLDQTDCESQIG